MNPPTEFTSRQFLIGSQPTSEAIETSRFARIGDGFFLLFVTRFVLEADDISGGRNQLDNQLVALQYGI